MWYYSYDNGEPSQLSQDTASYQMFGTLSEPLSQDDCDEFTDQDIQQPMDHNTPRFPAEARSQMGSSYIREFPEEDCASGSQVVQDDGNAHAQASPAVRPRVWKSGTARALKLKAAKMSKSELLNTIQIVESESFALVGEIEEQKRRNASLVKQIEEAKERLSKVRAQKANLLSEYKAFEEHMKEKERKVDEERKQVREIIAQKKENISKMKKEAEMVQALREEKVQLAEDLQKLRDECKNLDLDNYWLDHTYKQELDKMVIFPFWKLEEDLERAQRGEDPTLHDEQGPPERDEDEGDGYDYEDHDFYRHEDENDDEKEEELPPGSQELPVKADETCDSASYQSENKSPENDSCQSPNGGKFSKFIATMSLRMNAGRKNQKTKYFPQLPPGSQELPVKADEMSDSASYQSENESLQNDSCQSANGGKFSKFIATVSFRKNAGQKKQEKKSTKSCRFVHWLRGMSCIPKGNRDD